MPFRIPGLTLLVGLTLLTELTRLTELTQLTELALLAKLCFAGLQTILKPKGSTRGAYALLSGEGGTHWMTQSVISKI